MTDIPDHIRAVEILEVLERLDAEGKLNEYRVTYGNMAFLRDIATLKRTVNPPTA